MSLQALSPRSGEGVGGGDNVFVIEIHPKESNPMDADISQNNIRPQLSIRLPAIFRNVQVIQAIAQIAFVVIFVSLFFVLWSNISSTLASRNLYPSFDFLENRAGFDISEKPDWYTPSNTYGEAFNVGVINTLRVVSVGLVLSTIIGVFIGIFLLSRNWLIRTISKTYVEILRNTPLLVQLIFWYFVVMFSLPVDDITFPSEGIFMLPLRVLIYPVLLIALWMAGRRNIAPRQSAEGVLLGAILIEIAHRLLGSSLALTLVLGGIGVGFIIASRMPNFKLNRGQFLGIGVAGAGQAILGGIFALLVNSGALSADVLWWEVYPAVYVSLRAWVFPEIATTATFQTWLIVVLIGAVIGFGVYRYFFAYSERTGKLLPSGLYGLAVLIVISAIGWAILSNQPEPTEIMIEDKTVIVAEAREAGDIGFHEEILISQKPVIVSLPERGRFRFEVGSIVSPEYLALLLGLVVYTSAFIGEIVRAGIQAVSYGQTEAARAIGLSSSQTLRLVVMPQALRLIIPPLSNQYLNLSKNSSLAVAVAFADTYQVGLTMMNQSGQSVTGFTMILVTYLSMSLVVSVAMNLINSRFQLKTR